MFVPVLVILLVTPKETTEFDIKLFFKKGQVSKNNLGFFLVFIIILVWSVTRGNISVDIEKTYHPLYDIIRYAGVSSHYDPLFNFLNVLVIKTFNNFQAFLAVTALLYISCVFYASKKLSESSVYSIILFIIFNYLYNGLDQMRQYVGISFFCLALCCLSKGKNIKAIILIIIAGLNHSACYLLLLVVLLNKIRLSKTIYRNILIISPVTLLFAEPIVDYVLANYYGGHYAIYVEGGNYGFWGKFIIPLVTCWGLAIIYYVLYDDLAKEKNFNLYANLVLCSCVLSLYGTLSSETIRIVKMFFFGEIFFIPSIFKYLKKRKSASLIWKGYISFIFAYFVFYTCVTAVEYPYEMLTYIN